ncbi:PASTA domain containing protein [Elusimicrobium minutum Pei191]|uniref:PASTA domain containing protein n=1 Tax=Elusimicrobium minutum (strain Pei191) TaxID=445932 RepID=B2KCQ3_ELUMP|nr:PASTA domain-containing protein [Elusimicrobium minutum]ACC98299.1 PASTA domain containing protein [Elusimicrobium minutum Pei191]
MSNEFFNEVANKKSKNKAKRPNRKIAFIAVTLIFFAGLIYVSVDWALDALIHTRKEVPVPDLTSKKISEALDLLAASNLAMKKAGEEISPDAAPGSVVRQIPSQGSVVREGRIIRVWVSATEEEFAMPNLIGMTLRNAQLYVRQNGLMTGNTDNAYSNEYEKGSVIDQTPKVDSMVRKGSVVSLIISNGPPPADVILIPEFRLKKLFELTRWASSNDIEVEIKDDPKSAFPNGTITEQSPIADSELKRGSTVYITVSRRKVEGEEKTYRLHYELPQGKNSSHVRVVLIDKDGEKDIINETKTPGSKIDMDVPYGSESKIRIYVNGILVREREVK